MGKITEQEQKQLNEIKNDVLSIIGALGELEYQKTVLEIQITEQKEKVKQVKSKESWILKQLENAYGNVSINLETGEYS